MNLILMGALHDGIIISFLLGIWILLILKVNPRYEMKSYPPEILKAVPVQTKKEKSSFLIMAIPMLLIAIIFLIFSCISTYESVHTTYFVIVLHLFIALMVWNVIDLLVLDWLIFCKITPKFLILPGSKGNEGYHNYRYHFTGFLKGIVYSVASALILGLIVYFFQVIPA